MKIETQRLFLKPLSEQEMKDYLLDDFSLELSLNLVCKPRVITDRVRMTIESKIIPNIIDKNKNALFYTFWTVIDKKENAMIADICFKGEPNINGEVELGYGTYPHFQGKGFMTEAIGGIIKWAFTQNKINSVLAETDPTNIASIKVLKNNKFKVKSQTKDNVCWYLIRE